MKLFSTVAHPVLLGILVVVNIPLFIGIARTLYRNTDDAADDVAEIIERAVLYPSVMNSDNYPRVLKAVFYVMGCAAFVKMEYVFISWLMN